jgi:hypothetical protein
MAKFEFRVRLPLVGCVVTDDVEIDDDEFEGLTEEEQDEVIEKHWQEWAWEHIDGGWKRKEGKLS